VKKIQTHFLLPKKSNAILFYIHKLRKYKSIYSDRNQLSTYLGTGSGQELRRWNVKKGQEEVLGMVLICINLI
jgi:hypothetical protein